MYNLVLITLNPDRTDPFGRVYPESGLVLADDYTPDQDLSKGLFGSLWGKTGNSSFLKADLESVWIVVKIGEDIIEVEQGLVKFEQGLVIHSGDKQSASKFICDFKNAEGLDFYDGEIAGMLDEASAPNHHAVATGYDAKALSRVTGMHAIAANHSGKAISIADEAHAVGLGSYSEVASIGDESSAIVAGHISRAHACGDRCKAVALDSSSKAIATGEAGVAVCLEIDGLCAAGPDGTLIMAYWEIGVKRFAIGYVGQGVQPNLLYRCENGQFIEYEDDL